MALSLCLLLQSERVNSELEEEADEYIQITNVVCRKVCRNCSAFGE